tara:strand:- start:1016 stop:1192 length:177 start_codon:yes stop_codon:yes gene_type:complete
MSKTYECRIKIDDIFPVRKANSKEEFIRNLIEEYNNTCGHLFEISRSDISEITEEDNE